MVSAGLVAATGFFTGDFFFADLAAGFLAADLDFLAGFFATFFYAMQPHHLPEIITDWFYKLLKSLDLCLLYRSDRHRLSISLKRAILTFVAPLVKS